MSKGPFILHIINVELLIIYIGSLSTKCNTENQIQVKQLTNMSPDEVEIDSEFCKFSLEQKVKEGETQ